MKIMFWKIRAEVETKEITLAEYNVIKKWLTDNKIKHRDRYGYPGDGWAYVAWINFKENHDPIEGHEHIFKFYRVKDAVFFKTTWGGVDV